MKALMLVLSAATSAVTEGRTLPVASGVAAVRAINAQPGGERERARTQPTSESSPASEAAESVEASRPPRFTTQVTLPREDPATTLAIIRNAAAEFGVDAGEMERVAFCESSLRAAAVGDNGAAVGLFQWHLAPFLQHARQLYHRDVGDLREDPVVASLVTAFTVSRQGWGIWTCKP